MPVPPAAAIASHALIGSAGHCRGVEEDEGLPGGGAGRSLAAILVEGLAKLLLHEHLRGGVGAPGRLERGDVREVGCQRCGMLR